MNPFSYISFLTSVVIALGVTRVLTGLGRLLYRRTSIRIYWVQVMWAINVFLFLLLDWWILYRWQTHQTWNFFLFVFVLLTPIIAFMLSVLLFPDPLEAGIDLKSHFYQNRRSFFLLAALLPPLDAFDTLLKGWEHFVAQGLLYPLTITILFGLMVTAFLTGNEKYHKFFSIFIMVYILAFISINLNLLV